MGGGGGGGTSGLPNPPGQPCRAVSRYLFRGKYLYRDNHYLAINRQELGVDIGRETRVKECMVTTEKD